ncbi:putative cytochrome p450 4v3 protein [Eutypa lata UCREL1]|uniref:Putative cytochrome p450 4v3 protein n=1 Tax=Eutypa lata (strain UCR-EL1) TaxID=1287681 RepID=M7TNV7_EUTLA|nr:putative cytochrome p450 4v3 protein [Eutypa lata UCREL1]
MDVWPVSFPMLAVFHPDMNAQFTQDHSLPKYWAQGNLEFKHFTGGRDLVHLEGQEWKTARAIFNPGFSARNLLSLIPSFVEEVLVFKERLHKVADSDEIVKLEDFTTPLTVDIIGRAVLGARLHSQIRENPLMSAMTKQLGLLYFQLNLWKQLSPTRHIKHWMYNRQFRNAMLPLIQDTVRNYEKIEGPKTVLSLALKSYINEVQDYSARGSIPPEFIEGVVQHVKIFLFAGHDTTATTLAYSYYQLSQHPDMAARTRAEHDEVLGTDRAAAADLIIKDPTLLNKMPYTLGIIKEALRLYPPVGGTIREGAKGFFITNPQTGTRYPTEGFMVHSSESTLQRDPHYWPEADRFLPDRWLIRDESDPYYPVKNTWRPFEMGPRNCIGQELAQLEMKLVLALTVREFDFQDMYPEDAPTMFGYKAYQVELPELVATGHVKGKLPVKVKTR